MSQITINFQISVEELTSILQAIAAGQISIQTLAEIRQIKDLLMTQNESIKALKDAVDASKAKISDAVANLAADIKGLQDKLGTLGDLSAENQAIVDGVIADMGKAADSVKTAADIVPDVTEQP